MIYRQGDLLFRVIKNIPTVKPVKGNILVRGEATGHSHRVAGGDIFRDKNGLLYLKVLKEAKINHEEHKTIKLGKGNYAVIRQREYVSGDMVRIVVD
ncbi:hypothetical protein HY345_01735 [Candidatus Microgenomates bacterium]|nr:hypothetical protein [Candidatus Microgenomates bacterium]